MYTTRDQSKIDSDAAIFSMPRGSTCFSNVDYEIFMMGRTSTHP